MEFVEVILRTALYQHQRAHIRTNKFMDKFLEIMDIGKSSKEHFLVMDNCTIHKSKPTIRQIDKRGYRAMYLPHYLPELNSIEGF